MADFITRAAFDENGYPEGFVKVEKKKRHLLPWAIGGVLVVLGIAAAVFFSTRLSPAEKGAEAILNAYRATIGKNTLFFRETGLTTGLSEMDWNHYKTSFSLAFKETDYSLAHTNLPGFMKGFDLNYLGGAGVKITNEHGENANLLDLAASYGAISVDLLRLYSNKEQWVIASPNLVESTFVVDRNMKLENWEELAIWELLPEKYADIGKEVVRAVLRQRDRWTERMENANYFSNHLLQVDTDILWNMLLGFDYEKVGLSEKHYKVLGEKQAVTIYRATADTEAFGRFLSFLLDWDGDIVKASGKDGAQNVEMLLYIGKGNTLAAVQTDFVITIGGIEIPVSIDMELFGKQLGGDAFRLTMTLEKSKTFGEDLNRLLALSLNDLATRFGQSFVEDMDAVLSVYGTMTVGEFLWQSGIMTEEEVENFADSITTEKTVITVTKDSSKEDGTLYGEWTFDVSTDRINLGTLNWNYSYDERGKLNILLEFGRNGKTYFSISGDGRLTIDTENKSYALNFSKLTFHESHTITFKLGFSLAQTDADPVRPTGTKERNVLEMTRDTLDELKEEWEKSSALIRSILEMIGI